MTPTLRVVTLNIHKGLSHFNRRMVIHELRDGLRALDPDLVFLQEVQGLNQRFTLRFNTCPLEPQYEFLAGDRWQHIYGCNAVYDHGHHGNALLSCYPILSFRNQDVSDHAFEARGILHCVVQTQQHNVHCYVVHLGLFAGSRKRQTEALIDAVKTSAPPDAPVIIAGDFNDWTNQLSDVLRERLSVCEVFDQNLPPRGFGSYLRSLSGRGVKIQPARTFPAALPWLRLDRIYVRGFRVESAQVMHGALWAKLSDHAPIIADLALK